VAVAGASGCSSSTAGDGNEETEAGEKSGGETRRAQRRGGAGAGCEGIRSG